MYCAIHRTTQKPCDVCNGEGIWADHSDPQPKPAQGEVKKCRGSERSYFVAAYPDGHCWICKDFDKLERDLRDAIGHSNCYCDSCKDLTEKHWTPASGDTREKKP